MFIQGTLESVLFLIIAMDSWSSTQRPAGFDPRRGSLARDESQAIYSTDPADPWNRVFHFLFTRTLRVRLPAPGAAPFMAGDDRFVLSDHVVTRIESGDRAIDPLYPSLLWMGSFMLDGSVYEPWQTLREPRYSQLLAALTEAASVPKRPPLARALMQADLWAAYDILRTPSSFRRPGLPAEVSNLTAQRRDQLLALLARLIQSLALSRDEIAALPDTYSGAARRHHLPDLFSPTSEWFEVRWFSDRTHDRAADRRRAARVFVKPAATPTDVAAFLDGLRDSQNHRLLDAVALVTQMLLVANDGSVAPSSLVSEVQIRSVARDAEPRPAVGRVRQLEISRRLLLLSPNDGGLAESDEDAPMYLPAAGNDYAFASPSLRRQAEQQPVLVPMRQRCAACHGAGIGALMTFSVALGPASQVPPVEHLQPAQNAHARSVAARKMALESFRALLRHWDTTRN